MQVEWEATSVTVTGPEGGKGLVGVDVDMGDMPDAAMTLAVAALFAEGTTTIRNVENWRVKETERMYAICTELRKLGATVEEGQDFCVITPPAQISSAAIETYDDHRMVRAPPVPIQESLMMMEGESERLRWACVRQAMSFSLAACGGAPITILDPKCTRKTFPDYFDVLATLTASA
eukprot:scaffold6422_cov350-Prasinococcus_capsulatus_cf.AAC.4